MRKLRVISGLTMSVLLILAAFGVVMAQEDPLSGSIFLPGELASAGGNTILEIPFVIAEATVGEPHAFCISYPNTIAPNWPASSTAVSGDVYTLNTGANVYCAEGQTEYSVPAASEVAISKEEIDFPLTFGPQPSGSTYTFTIAQVGAGIAESGPNNAPVSTDLSIAAPTAIQLDSFEAPSSNQLVFPALLLILAIGSLGFAAHANRQ